MSKIRVTGERTPKSLLLCLGVPYSVYISPLTFPTKHFDHLQRSNLVFVLVIKSLLPGLLAESH